MNPQKSILESGLYFPNNFARIFMLSLEDVIGVNGLNAILNQAGQSDFIGNYPPNDTDKEFDYSYFSSIAGALEELYGSKGARILAVRAGNVTFKQMLKDFGEPLDIKNESFTTKPLVEKVSAGLAIISDTFSNTKEAPIILTEGDHFLCSVKYCPSCWGRTTSTPSCYLISGILQASLKWVTSGCEFNITQTKAHSCGDASCDFIVPATPLN